MDRAAYRRLKGIVITLDRHDPREQLEITAAKIAREHDHDGEIAHRMRRSVAEGLELFLERAGNVPALRGIPMSELERVGADALIAQGSFDPTDVAAARSTEGGERNRGTPRDAEVSQSTMAALMRVFADT